MSKPRRKANGVYTLVVQYLSNRKNLTLGRITKSAADQFAGNIQSLLDHAKYGGRSMPAPLQAWVLDLNERHKIQLSEIGLFEYRSSDMTAGELIRQYVDDYESRSDIGESTKKKVRSTINNRLGKLDKAPLDMLEPKRLSIRQNAEPLWSDEAKRFFTTLNSWQRNHFAPATWTRDNKLLSSVGIWAVERGICEHNPFVNMPSASMVNDERNEHIAAEMVKDAMDACLSPDIRLTLFLGRFAGLRTCSEFRTLKWSYVDESAQTLTILDSKTKKPRVMPLFDEIAEELERQRRLTGDTRFVASAELRSTSSAANYSRCKEAITRSGQEVWDRVRQNLRSSCENDLLEIFEERLVTRWIGHSVNVSRKHYQKLRPSDYANAIDRKRSQS